MNKKKIFIITIIATSIFLSILFAINNQRKNNIKVVPFSINNPKIEVNTQNIIYTGTTIETPDKMETYSNSGETINEFAKILADKLGLSQSSISNKIWTNTETNSYLSIDTNNNLIEYSVDKSVSESENTKPILKKSTENARTFLEELGLTDYLSDKPATINYYEGYQFVESSPDQAEIIEMYFPQALDGIPISIDIYRFSDIKVLTGSNNEVVKAIFPANINFSKKLGKIDIIDIAKAIELVESSQGDIIEIIPADNQVITKAELGKITLDKVQLEYRLSLENNVLYPYFKFEGISTLANNSSVDVIIIVPAISKI